MCFPTSLPLSLWGRVLSEVFTQVTLPALHLGFSYLTNGSSSFSYPSRSFLFPLQFLLMFCCSAMGILNLGKSTHRFNELKFPPKRKKAQLHPASFFPPIGRWEEEARWAPILSMGTQKYLKECICVSLFERERRRERETENQRKNYGREDFWNILPIPISNKHETDLLAAAFLSIAFPSI